uniref:Uncharacterized protein n=1 Tax=Arundo donax TaxID=35708 RepID=A0A0A9ASZ1_ARUDO
MAMDYAHHRLPLNKQTSPLEHSGLIDDLNVGEHCVFVLVQTSHQSCETII